MEFKLYEEERLRNEVLKKSPAHIKNTVIVERLKYQRFKALF
jgi:hypothetical protein